MKIRSRSIKVLFAFVLLAAAVAFAGWKWGLPYYKARQELQAADDSEAHFKYAAAHDHIVRAAKFWPRNGEVQLKAARMSRRAGIPDEAKTYLDNARLLLGQPAISLEQQLLAVQTSEASTFAEQALYNRGLNEHDIRSLVLEAFIVAALNNARPITVKELADKWLAEPTDDPRPWYWRGLAESLVGATSTDDLAISDLTKAVELDADYDDARSRLCKILLSKNVPEARKQYEIFLQRRPDSVDAMIGLGECFAAAGENDNAKSWLDKALERAPRNVEALRERGILALTEGHADQAEPLLRKAYDLDPRDLSVSHNLAVCLRRLGKDDEANKFQLAYDQMKARKTQMDQLRKDYQEHPADPNFMLAIGKLYLELGDKDSEAMGLHWIIDRALRTDPKHVPSLKTLIDHLEKAGRPDKAAYFRQMLPENEGK